MVGVWGKFSMIYSYGIEDDEFLDLFCVHYAIHPQVNRCYEEFTESWNNRSLSSIHNFTQDALFKIGLLEKQRNESVGEHNITVDSDFSVVNLAPHGGIHEVTVGEVATTPAHLCCNARRICKKCSLC